MTRRKLGDSEVQEVDGTPRDGDVVVVDIDGERSFKVWKGSGKRVALAFANPRYPAFVLDPGATIEVWGVVSNTIRQLRRAARG